MKARELRELSADELRTRVRDGKKKLFTLRFQLASGRLTNTAEIAKAKREVARTLTLLKERDHA